jgi:LacI family transcriptional regulator
VATLADVARAAGVSVSVVSRVLNNDPALRAREDTRDRVRAAAAKLSYTPNHAARALRLSHAETIAVVVPDVTNAIVSEVLRGVEDASVEAGLQVLLGRSHRLQPGDNPLRRLVDQGRVDGFLLQTVDDQDAQEAEQAIGNKVPVVLLHARGAHKGSVIIDDAKAAQIATDHLLKLGHTDIAFVSGPPKAQTARRREQGFAQAMAAAGVRRRSAWTLHAGYRPSDGRRAAHELLESDRRPTAIIVANANSAAGALKGAQECGVSIPDELSIVSIHDTWVSEMSTPGLTTVKTPLYDLGGEGVRQLTARLSGNRAEDVMITDPPPVLVKRASTAPPPTRPKR